MSDKLGQATSKAKAKPATKGAAETYLETKGMAKSKVDKAKTKDLAGMVCEVHGVSDAEYAAARR